MSDKFVDRVYDTLNGVLDGEYAVPGVPDAFRKGSYCLEKYDEVFQANVNLCNRLGSGDDDADVETIINCMFDIQREMCYQMYYIGYKIGASTSNAPQNANTETHKDGIGCLIL